MVDSDTRVSDLPAIAGDVLDEARKAIAAFEAANVPAAADEISRMIGKISILFPNAKLSDAEARAQNQLYSELLSDVPQDVLAGAFRKCAQTLRFFPSVAEIRAAAMPEMAMRSWRLMRLRAIVLESERRPVEPDKEIVTPEQRAAIKAELGLTGEAAELIDRIVGDQAA